MQKHGATFGLGPPQGAPRVLVIGTDDGGLIPTDQGPVRLGFAIEAPGGRVGESPDS